MLEISKSPEPAELTRFIATVPEAGSGWAPRYEGLDAETRRAIWAALVNEQQGVCCYCGVRIEPTAGSSHVEHLVPQSRAPELQLAWTNMLASCEGRDPREPRATQEHCGAAKGDQLLPIHPLTPGCSSAFDYLEDGRVRAVAGHGRTLDATEAIAVLALDGSRLVAARKAAVTALIDIATVGGIAAAQSYAATTAPLAEFAAALRAAAARW